MTTLRRTTIFVSALLIVATALLLLLTLSPLTALAGDPVPYVDAALFFNGESYSGLTGAAPRYSIDCLVWTGSDLATWQKAPDTLETVLRIYDQEGNEVDPALLKNGLPYQVGSYTAKLYASDLNGKSYNATDGSAVIVNSTVLASMSYRVVDANVNIITGPEADLSYNGQNQIAAVTSATAVYYKGKLVQDGNYGTYSITVKKGGSPVATVQDVGEYTVTVSGTSGEISGVSHTSTFRVIQSAKYAVSLKANADLVDASYTTYGGKFAIYAGAYTSAGQEANRLNYYGLSFAGALSNLDGTINTAYATLSYWQDDLRLAWWNVDHLEGTLPTAAGNYVCRVTMVNPYAEYGLSANDYIDLPYVIRPVPYLPVYIAGNGAELLDTSFAPNCYRFKPAYPTFDINVSKFVLEADDSTTVDLSVASSSTYRYTGDYLAYDDPLDWQSVEHVTGKGLYRTVYTVNLAAIDPGIQYFGTANADYKLNASNCTFTYEFQVVGNYSVEGIERAYTVEYASTGYTSNVRSLNPRLYNGEEWSSADVVEVIFVKDGVAVDLGDIKDDLALGNYFGYFKFKKDWTRSSSGTVVAQKDDVYRFEFTVSVARQPVHTFMGAENEIDNVLAEQWVVESLASLGIFTDARTYYRVVNGICDNFIDKNDLCDLQGTYRVAVPVTGGTKYDGSVICFDFVKQSDGRIDSIVFDVPELSTSDSAVYTGNLFAAQMQYDNSDTATVYYKKRSVNDAGTVSWTVCDYPQAVGTYRAIMRFDKANPHYDAVYGDEIYREFDITPLTLKVSAAFDEGVDNVYDGTAKAVDCVFYINRNAQNHNLGYPVDQSVVKRFIGYDSNDFVEFYYSVSPNSQYPTYIHSAGMLPADAGVYGVGLLLRHGDYSCFSLAVSDETPDSIQVRQSVLSYFLRCGTLRVSKLMLDAVVVLPIGSKALYTGAAVMPEYKFYKGNDMDPEIEKPENNRTGFVGDNAIVTYELKYKNADNPISQTVEGGLAKQAGTYTHQLNIAEAYRANVVFGRILTNDISSDPVLGVNKSSDTFMTVTYRINPLPLYVEYTDLSSRFVKAGDYYQAYYGEVYKIAAGDITLSTLDVNGNRQPVALQYFDVVLYKRLSNSSQRYGVITDDSCYRAGKDEFNNDIWLFVEDSYTLSVVFGADEQTQSEMSDAEREQYELEKAKYVQYQLVDGTGLTSMGTLQEGSEFNVMFDVLPAQAMRVSFEADFASYTYYETPTPEVKNFNIRFFVGNSERVLQEGEDYDVLYSWLDNGLYVNTGKSSVIGSPTATVNYRVGVFFKKRLCAYRVEQYQGKGTYVPVADDPYYIAAGDMVTYEFCVMPAGKLSWGWGLQDGYSAPSATKVNGLSSYYDGNEVCLSVRFVSAQSFSDSATPVNMDRGTDYDVWYYVKKGNYYEKIAAPVEPGDYLAELVFMHDISDYRYDTSYIYSYINAELGASRYGRSLMNHAEGEQLGNLKTEDRFVDIHILRPTLSFTGLSAQNKVFDGTDTATVVAINKNSYTLSEGCTGVVGDSIQPLWRILSYPVYGAFDYVGVHTKEDDVAVTYWIRVGNASFQLPHSGKYGGSGTQYLLQQIAVWLKQSADSETVALVKALQKDVEELAKHYDFVLQDLTAAITKATIVIAPHDFSRYYDPDFDDTDKIDYDLSAAHEALLHRLVVAGYSDQTYYKNYFEGCLSREDEGNASINADGYPIVLGTLHLVGNQLTLKDARQVGNTSTSTLAANIDLAVSSARYKIDPAPITLDVAIRKNGTLSSDISRSYIEDEPELYYFVSQGALLFMDELRYVDDQGRFGAGCDLSKQRKHSSKEFDDVGEYDVSYANVRVYRYEQDVTENYVISGVDRKFRITSVELVLLPNLQSKTYEVGDDLDDDLRSLPIKVYITENYEDSHGLITPRAVEFAKLQSQYHAAVYASFRREEIENTDPAVYRRYKLSLDSVKVETETGDNLTSNFTFVLSKAIEPLVVYRYKVDLYALSDNVQKLFGQADPHIDLAFLKKKANEDPNPHQFVIEGEPSRAAGEDKGEYYYVSSNLGSIIIKDKDGNDVSSRCYVTVYDKTGYAPLGNNLKLTIDALPVTVTVRAETLYKTGKAIIPTIIYLDSQGNIISSAITSKIKAKYEVPDVNSLLNSESEEDTITITPTLAANSPIDENFVFTTAPGQLTIRYPWNILSVKVEDKDSAVAQDNRIAFTGGVLYKTLQLYSVSSLDGGKQTRTIEVKLPVTDAMLEEDVYVLCVHYDNSYVMRNATYQDGYLTVSDDEFKYVLVVQPLYWPYIVLSLAVVLVAIGVAAFAMYNRFRVKVRGKKERKHKEKKPKKQKATKVEPIAAAPVEPAQETEDEDMDFVDDTVDEEQSPPPVDEDTLPPIAQEPNAILPVQEPVKQAESAAESAEKGKKTGKKDKKSKKAKDDQPTAFVPGAAPVRPSAPVAPITPQDQPLAPLDNINTLSLPDVDDDEIVINTVTRRVDDE